MEGWVKLHRKMLDNPIVCKDADHVALWIYLLLNATHKPYPALFKGERIELQPGQLITGRNSLATYLQIDRNKIERILKTFENEQQIEQQTSNKNRIITVLSWCKYQISEQQDEQQVSNKRATSEQQVSTNKNVRTEEQKKSGRFSPPQLSEIESYISEKGLNVDGKKFFDYFTEGNWIDSKGNKVKNWKQKLQTWSNKNGGNKAAKTVVQHDLFQSDYDPHYEQALRRRQGGNV